MESTSVPHFHPFVHCQTLLIPPQPSPWGRTVINKLGLTLLPEFVLPILHVDVPDAPRGPREEIWFQTCCLALYQRRKTFPHRDFIARMKNKPLQIPCA